MNTLKETFLDFFKNNTENSMGRLIVFICAACAALLTIAGMVGMLLGKFDAYYAGFVLSLWAAAFGGKNWAKSVENKKVEEKER